MECQQNIYLTASGLKFIIVAHSGLGLKWWPSCEI